MPASLRLVLHSKIYDDGTQPVMLQCIASGPAGKVWKRKSICRVKATQFDKQSGRVKAHPNKTLLNAKLVEAYTQAEERLLTLERIERQTGQPIDPAAVLADEQTPLRQAGMLLAHAETYVERCRQKGQFHTAEKYNGHLGRIKQYLGKTSGGTQIDLALDAISEDWVLGFAGWLKANGTKSANTLHRRMAFLTTLFNDARKRGLSRADPMAFLEFKEQKVRKPKLTAEQIRALEEIELTGALDDTRNTFLLQFYCYGTRISDALLWRKSDLIEQEGARYLCYTSMKTGDLIDVRLNERARVLVERYGQSTVGEYLLPWLSGFVVFPNLTDEENRNRLIQAIESKTTTINNNLKSIARRLGWELRLTTHIARHTFATLADQKVTDKRKLSAALGHAKFSTTEVYLADLRRTDVNDAMDEVWK